MKKKQSRHGRDELDENWGELLDKSPFDGVQRLYFLSVGSYVQYGPGLEMPEALQRVVDLNGGEFPPFIPLPNGPVTFDVAGEFVSKKTTVTWDGEGHVPSEVIEYVIEHGVLPRHIDAEEEPALKQGKPSRKKN